MDSNEQRYVILAFNAYNYFAYINIFIGILSSFDMPALIIQWSLSVAGLALYVLSLNDSKVKESKSKTIDKLHELKYKK